jgi:tetratricopeptide (TPR) repeat protein
VRAHVAASATEGAPRTIELYRGAAERLAAEGQALGEVIARTNLRRLYMDGGDRAAADAQVELGLRAARQSGDREAVVRASILEASHLTDLGEDLGRAHRALRRAEEGAFPDGAPGLQQSVLRRSANLSYQLGRYGEAVEKLERLLAATRALGNSGGAALRYNILTSRRAEREVRPVAGALAEVRQLAEQSLTSAQEERDPAVEARTHAVLAELLAVEDPDGAAVHVRRCLELARGLDRRLPELDCLSAAAQQFAPRRPAEAVRALDRAARIALAEGNDLLSAYVWHARLRTAWDVHPPAEAAAESLRALDAIERIRGAQGDPDVRIHVLANWTKDYYWLVGRLLGGDAPDYALAFAVMEMMRARVLLEGLEASGLERAAPEAQALGPIRSGIAGVQRQLLDPSLPEERRKALLVELERRELDEAEVLAGTGTAGPRGAIGRARLATLAEVQARLHPDEALVVFAVGLDHGLDGAFGGGAWAMGLTRERVSAWRVPDRLKLEATVPVLSGLLERRDGSEAAVAAAFHQQLLDAAGDSFGAGLRRLVIVPDGVLHELPFAALRSSAAEAPLGVRYEVVLAPSATLWARWRSSPAPRARSAALVLADPEPSMLDPLPHARSEGRHVRSTIGGGSRLLAGRDATEAALKASYLTGFGIVHFATHAIADDVYPDRSAVVLGPGAETEDGLLQPREVTSLDLSDRAVVLSACRAAAGPVASGEGVLSLARAFFQAGSRTVVASRSRLRDDEAERFFRSFYGHLRRGETMGAALRLARQRARDEGMPAATWASVDLLGDADLVLDVPPPPTAASRAAIVVIGVLALAAMGWSAVRFARN